MKKKMLILACTGILGSFLFSACNNQEKKMENASENVVEAQQDLSDAEREYAEEWEKFKAEYDARIQLNENDIATYREMEKNDPVYKSKYRSKIDELENRNIAMRERMRAYEAERRKDNWREFKEEFKHDMDELGAALKDFGKDNK